MLAKAIFATHISKASVGEVIAGKFRYRITPTSVRWLGIIIRWISTNDLCMENDNLHGPGLEQAVSHENLLRMVCSSSHSTIAANAKTGFA